MLSSNISGDNVTFSRADLVAANDKIALNLIPVMLILGVMIVLGVLGNSLVCYVFCFRLQPRTQNYLIVYLAVFDLLSSTIAMPWGIVVLRYILMFESEATCKIMSFITTFCAMGSIFTLIVIAVDRFRKVCRPLKKQLRVVHIKYLLIPILGGALFTALPALIVYGLRTKDSGVPWNPGSDCSTDDLVQDTIVPVIYNGFLFLAFRVTTVSLITIYWCVLRETKHHIRYMKKNSNFGLPPSNSNKNFPSAGKHQTARVTSDTTPQTAAENVPHPEEFIRMASSGYSKANIETKALNASSDPSLIEKPQVKVREEELVNEKILGGEIKSEEKEKKFFFQLDSDDGSDVERNTARKYQLCIDTDLKKNKCCYTFKTASQEEISSNDCSTEKTNEKFAKRNAPVVRGGNCTKTYQIDSCQLEKSSSEEDIISHCLSSSKLRQSNVQPFQYEANCHITANLPSSRQIDSNDAAASSGHLNTSKNNPDVFCIAQKTNPPCEETKKKKDSNYHGKTTLIAFLVTLVFILSFLPHLCLQISKHINTEYDSELRGADLVFYSIFLRSYFLNSVLNPFIYGVLNVKFKTEVKILARRFKTVCIRK